MLNFDTTAPMPPHVIDEIRKRRDQERQREEERRLPLELPLGPPPGWKRNPGGEWIRDEGDHDRDDGDDGITIQMC